MKDPGARLEYWLRRGDRRASGLALLGAGLAALSLLWMLESWLQAHAALAESQREAAQAAREDLELELSERQHLRELLAKDLRRAKEQATSLSKSRRALFEGGLALADERRALEKQLEMMTTFLQLDGERDRVHVMRGEQAYESWPLEGAQARAAGGESRPLPKLAVIVSKERFAAPERGRSVQQDGRLDWEPPQVGQSVRANALGEHVMFTREGLVVHGPPLKKAEHEAYPHLCLSLPAHTARRVYLRSFIGTKILLK